MFIQIIVRQRVQLTNTTEDYQLHLTTLLHINKLMKPILYKNCYMSPSERHPNTQVQWVAPVYLPWNSRWRLQRSLSCAPTQL